MDNNQECDSIIKREFSNIANEIENTDNSLQDILIEVQRKQDESKLNAGFIKKYIAIACIACVVLLTPFIFSANARAMAVDVINSVKMVFVMDKSNQIIEKPASEVLISPAVPKETQLSDEELSEKIGIKICIPQTLCGDYNLERKFEAVVFNKELSYEAFEKIIDTAEEAINNEDVFQGLKEYEPYRCVGCIYRDSSGKTVAIEISSETIITSSKNSETIETVQTKVGQINADWIGVSLPDYNGQDMTKKPIGKKICYILHWLTNDANYMINTMDNQALSMDESVKIAEAFMEAQN